MRHRAALVVDDDIDLVRMLVAQLNAMGLAAHGCCSLKEAKQILPLLQPSLLLCDVRLPDGDGLTLCEAGLVPAKACRIIITGQRDASLVARAQKCGAHLVPKAADLITTVSRIIRSNVPLSNAA